MKKKTMKIKFNIVTHTGSFASPPSNKSTNIK